MESAFVLMGTVITVELGILGHVENMIISALCMVVRHEDGSRRVNVFVCLSDEDMKSMSITS